MDDGSGKGEKIKQQSALHLIILPRHAMLVSSGVRAGAIRNQEGRVRMLHLEMPRIPRLYGCAGIVSHLARYVVYLIITTYHLEYY